MDMVKIQQPTMASLYKEYMADPQKLVGYINLAKNLNISKAKKKRIKKFRCEIDRKKALMIRPLTERINILYQSLTKGHVNEKKFKEINLIHNNQSNLPFINVVLTTKKQNKTEGLALKQVLVDSGSEICILTEKMLAEFKIPSNCIKRNCQNLNVVTSNQVSKNCMLGTVLLDRKILLQSELCG